MKKEIAMIAVLAVVGTAQATMMSLNLHQYTGGIQKIDGGETYGVVNYNGLGTSTVTDNWANSTGSGWTDQSGTPIDWTAVSAGGKSSFAAAFNDTALKAGYSTYGGTPAGNEASITLSDLNAFSAGGVDIIVYMNGFAANDGAEITDGTTSYFFTDTAGSTTLIQTTDTNSGDGYDVANYAVFSGLSTDSVTLTLDNIVGGGMSLAGVQVIAIPEPATFGLFGIAGAGVLFARRRARS